MFFCRLALQSSYCHACSAVLYALLSISGAVLSLFCWLSPVSCAVHAICEYNGAQCRLWSTKQEQEKVLDEEATKRKQDAADAKVRCITHPQSQLTLIGQSINCLDEATYGNQDAANTMVCCVAGSLLVSHTQATLTSHDD